MNKYEQIVEYLTNGETDKARALFHEIAVTESRRIYESLISDEDFNEEVSDDKTGDMIDDISDEVEDEETSESKQTLGRVITSEEAKTLLDYIDGSLAEGDHGDLLEKVANFYGVKMESVKGALEENSDSLLDVAYGSVNEEGDDEEMPADDAVGGDEAMDMGGDEEVAGDEMGDEMSGDELGGEEAGEEEIEDRVMDLENALDELKAEFDELMADEMGEPEHADLGGDEMGDEMGGEEMPGDEMGDEMPMGDEMGGDDEMESMMSMSHPAESKDKTAGRSASDLMREYIEKVGTPENSEGKGVGDGGKEAVVNTKSTVAGKNDMGGTSKNLVKGGSNPAPDGTSAPSSDKPGKLSHAGSFQNVAGGKVKQSGAKSPVTSEPSGVNKRSPLAK